MHTPGPWFYDDGENGRYFPHVVLGGSNPKSREFIVVNTTRGQNGGTMEECQANARLIAAAPELLAALKQLLADDTPLSDYNAIRNARAVASAAIASAAIAKATGT